MGCGGSGDQTRLLVFVSFVSFVFDFFVSLASLVGVVLGSERCTVGMGVINLHLTSVIDMYQRLGRQQT
jgi:hypothetical protein